MSVHGMVSGGNTRLKVLLASVGLLAALLLVAPRDLSGAESWKECVDGAFADYNSCLMESSSWFNRSLCDLNWELETAVCTAGQLGNIREAFNEGTDDTAR